nr:hypothetical protein [Novosphingobium sp. B 225]
MRPSEANQSYLVVATDVNDQMGQASNPSNRNEALFAVVFTNVFEYDRIFIKAGKISQRPSA